MPVVSKAQFRKFHQMYKDGEISKKTLDEWTKGVNFRKLPKKKKKGKKHGRA